MTDADRPRVHRGVPPPGSGLIATEHLTIAEVARRLGVDATTRRNWEKKYRPTGAAPTASAQSSFEQELRRRWEETRQLKLERDILTEAAIDLAQPPG